MRFQGRGVAAAVVAVALTVSSAAQAQAVQGHEVRGTVWDSLAAVPLSGAQVALLDRGDQTVAPRSTKTDSAGHFRFEGVEPGTYVLGFEAPVLDSLGIGSPTRLVPISAATSGTIDVDLAVPGGRSVHNAFCPGRDSHDSTSALVGHLTDASTRGVISGGTVQVSWIGVAKGTHSVAVERVTSEAQSGNDGWFAVCDLPAGMSVAVVAMAGPDTSALVNLLVPTVRGLLRLELYLQNPLAPHTGRVNGVVKDETTSRPIAGAHVATEGAAVTAGSDGRFVLENVPYGTVLLTASARGYQPTQQQATVLVGNVANVTVPLLSTAMMSDTARTTAAAAIADKHGFTARKASWAGLFYTYKDLQRLNFRHTSELVFGRGIQSIDTGAVGGFAVISRNKPRRCTPTFYVDGTFAKDIRTPLDLDAYVPLASLAAVEIYMGLVPPQFPSQPSEPDAQHCGTFGLWTLPRPLWADDARH